MSDPLAEVDVPRAHELRVEPDGLVSRLCGTPALHRLVPGPVAVGLALARGEAEWHLVRTRRARAERQAALVAAPGSDTPAVRRLARAHLRELAVQTELSWRPWAARRMPLRGLEHLGAARAEGRGVLLAGAHLGPMLNLHHALAARGVRVYVVGGRHPDEPPQRGHEGRWVKTQNVWMEQAGNRWVRRGDAYRVIRALLGRGEVVWMAVDARGTTRVELLGREVHVGSGLSRLATETGAPVVPVTCRRVRGHQEGRLGPPLHARDAPSAEAFAQRVVDAVGAAIAADLPQAHAVLAVRFDPALAGRATAGAGAA